MPNLSVSSWKRAGFAWMAGFYGFAGYEGLHTVFSVLSFHPIAAATSVVIGLGGVVAGTPGKWMYQEAKKRDVSALRKAASKGALNR